MSLRPVLWSVPSVEPIRKVVGSNDRAWMEVVEAAVREREEKSPDRWLEYEAFRKAAAELLAGKVSGPENDYHVEVVNLWAEKALPLGGFDYDADPQSLDPAKARMLTDGDWKHPAWEEYRGLVQPLVEDDVARMVEQLTEGRPLAGTRTESGWSYYAWFEGPELGRLIHGLMDAANENTSVADDIDGFHGELIEWLQGARACGALWLYAS